MPLTIRVNICADVIKLSAPEILSWYVFIRVEIPMSNISAGSTCAEEVSASYSFSVLSSCLVPALTAWG